MPETMGQTLTKKVGPLPIWAWFILLVGGVGYYLYKKKQDTTSATSTPSTNTSSNLGTVPISNLTQDASPMPGSGGGDQFYPVGSGGDNSTTGNNVMPDPIPADNLQPAPAPIVNDFNPTVSVMAASDPGPQASVSAPSSIPVSSSYTPAQAQAAVSSGQLTPRAALASEVPASQETAAQRHAQEVANRSLRAQLKS